MKTFKFIPFVLCAGLAACSSYYNSRKTHVEIEEERRADLASQSALSMLDSRNLPPIEFDFDKSDLRPEAIKKLNDLAEILKADRKLKLILEGHCDEIGSYEYNEELALMRTAAVKEYLVTQGVWADSIQEIGYGKREPVALSGTDRARQLNRMVTMQITDRPWEAVF